MTLRSYKSDNKPLSYAIVLSWLAAILNFSQNGGKAKMSTCVHQKYWRVWSQCPLCQFWCFLPDLQIYYPTVPHYLGVERCGGDYTTFLPPPPPLDQPLVFPSHKKNVNVSTTNWNFQVFYWSQDRLIDMFSVLINCACCAYSDPMVRARIPWCELLFVMQPSAPEINHLLLLSVVFFKRWYKPMV